MVVVVVVSEWLQLLLLLLLRLSHSSTRGSKDLALREGWDVHAAENGGGDSDSGEADRPFSTSSMASLPDNNSRTNLLVVTVGKGHNQRQEAASRGGGGRVDRLGSVRACVCVR